MFEQAEFSEYFNVYSMGYNMLFVVPIYNTFYDTV